MDCCLLFARVRVWHICIYVLGVREVGIGDGGGCDRLVCCCFLTSQISLLRDLLMIDAEHVGCLV
jgi:hypothetical protein